MLLRRILRYNKRHTHFFVKITLAIPKTLQKQKGQRVRSVFAKRGGGKSFRLSKCFLWFEERSKRSSEITDTVFLFCLNFINFLFSSSIYTSCVQSSSSFPSSLTSKWAEWGSWVDLRRGNFINVQFMWSYYFVQIKQLAKPARLFKGDFFRRVTIFKKQK